MNNKEYDIVIVGGSVVGALFACAMQKLLGDQNSLRIALIDSSDLQQQVKPCADYDSRVFAINLATQNILIQLGLWDEIKAVRATPFNNMYVWNADSHIEFNSADIAYDRLGYIVEQRTLLWPALAQLKQGFQVDLYYSQQVSAFSRVGDNVEIKLESGDVFRTRLLVGADGANSQVRKFAGIDTLAWSYDQKAIVATVSTEKDHEFIAAQNFLQTGPLAFLPLDAGLSSIVWSADTELAEDLMALDDATFCVRLQHSFASRLGKVELVTPRAAFPLQCQHSKQYSKPGIVLIGDSAHVIHPLAGQGVNLGIMDAMMLAQTLADELTHSNFNPGNYALLRRYERSRKSENLMMMGVMDGFKRLFGTQLVPLQQLRNFGLRFVAQSPLLKNTIMVKALGLSGEIPEFVLGSERVS
ncbi:2-polyprenylphenol hydroxylase [hydrothermal vent metagenome]|uniref:2-polyprenylphenol hydroxylase n=1 Tax=hydrothermal vent metagenome TaxID=652676 RepID=A0A3B0Y2W7_9ZZZZ